MSERKAGEEAVEESPRNVHDGLFKDIFANPANAAALLQAVLPARVSRHINWPTLSLVQASVVGEGLSQRHGDLLFEARLHSGHGIYVRLIFEHQRTVDYDMALRIQTNASLLWKRYRRQHQKPAPLPPILSVVLYNGERRWNAPTSVVDMMQLPEEVRADLEPYLPSCRFVLDDLVLEESQGLVSRGLPEYALLGLAVMKYGRGADVVDRLVEHLSAIRVLLRDDRGREMVGYVLGYILRVNKHVSAEKLSKALEAALSPEEEESTMQNFREMMRETFQKALYEVLIQDARREGQREGREALQQALEVLIGQRFGVVPPAAAERIRAADSDELSGWLQRILQVESVDELFASTDENARQAEHRPS